MKNALDWLVSVAFALLIVVAIALIAALLWWR